MGRYLNGLEQEFTRMKVEYDLFRSSLVLLDLDKKIGLKSP